MKFEPKKTKSGKWNVHVHTYIDGKKTSKSFTAKNKAECIDQAKRYLEEIKVEKINNKRKTNRYESLTFSEAGELFISLKSNLLSPSTIRGYRSILRSNFDFNELELRYIDNTRLQFLINSLIAKGNGPKTIRNKLILIQTIIHYFIPEQRYNLQLPSRKQLQYHIPTKKQFLEIYNAAPEKLKIPILLGGYAGLRRGEICALRPEDVKPNGIEIKRSLAKDENNDLILKRPKTEAGVRFVPLAPELIKMLRSWNFDVKLDYITKTTREVCNKLGYPAIHFHCFRHFFATELYDQGMNPMTIIEYTGHSSPSMVTEVYAHSRRNIETDDQVIKTFKIS